MFTLVRATKVANNNMLFRTSLKACPREAWDSLQNWTAYYNILIVLSLQYKSLWMALQLSNIINLLISVSETSPQEEKDRTTYCWRIQSSSNSCVLEPTRCLHDAIATVQVSLWRGRQLFLYKWSPYGREPILITNRANNF